MKVIDMVDVAAFVMNLVKHRKVQLRTTKTPYILERREYLLVLHTFRPCLVHPKTKNFLRFSVTSNLVAHA
jgi:hypothetical protein